MEYGGDNELAATFDEMFETLAEISFDNNTDSCTCTLNCTYFCPTEGECW